MTSRIPARLARVWPLLLVLGSSLAGCDQAPVSAPKPLVVASFYPLYEFSRQVAGDRAEVATLVPPGVEPHDWEPSPQDIAQLQKAKVFVYNGAGFESWVEKLLDAVASKGALVVKATERIPLITVDLPGHDDPGHGKRRDPKDRPGQDKAPPDPHVWLDPVLAQAMVDNIRAGLAQADPSGAAVYGENARGFMARLETLHDAFAAGLKDCARRDIVVSHAAFGYLAQRYRLSPVPVMGLAPESEPSPAQLAAIVRFARQRKVKYIFFETLVSPKLAETLAREVGARTLVFNPIEGQTREEAAAGKGYMALMEENLKNLRTALECR
jgi:zinc transport system substrate-binding protein